MTASRIDIINRVKYSDTGSNLKRQVFILAKVKLLTDSSADLTDELYQRYDIFVVPFYVTFDKQTYYKERVEISSAEFYKKLRSEKVYPSTSLPSTGDYEEAFRAYLDQGMDVVCICLTSKFSGSYQNAASTAENIKGEYPDRVIRVIDSIQAACGQGLVVLQAALMARDGLGANEIADRIDRLKETARVFFTVDSLTYLQKGGRIGKVSALAGTILNIKPIIVMRDAELNPINKVRGWYNALEKVISLVGEYVGSERDEYEYILIDADCRDEAGKVVEKMKQQGYKIELPIMDLGITIGSHTGPMLVGVCMIKKYKA